MNDTNNEKINIAVTHLKTVRKQCDRIRLDPNSTIKLVEAKSDVLRAIRKLESLYDRSW